MDNQPNPSKRASDMAAMEPYWRKVSDILGGHEKMLEGASEYLPQLPDESAKRYRFRKSVSKFTNVFGDILGDLSQRPFAKEMGLTDGASDEITELCKDIDARGNSLHVFAGEVFFQAIANAVDWIMVDYTDTDTEGMTQGEEEAAGVRPYWVRYGALDVLSATEAMIGGRSEFTHVRLSVPVNRMVGGEEVRVDRVREFNRYKKPDGSWSRPYWFMWEYRSVEADGGSHMEWVQTTAPQPLTISRIPLVPVVTGNREGVGWRLRPPMRSSAELQIILFRQETGLEYAKNMLAYPMLSGNGVSPDVDAEGNPKPVAVGPGLALYAPHSSEGGTPSWTILEPNATSLRFLADDVKATISELRELGRQPLTAQSGNLTRISSAVAANKGNAAVQSWAIIAKDAFATALDLTNEWLKSTEENTVELDPDFDLSIMDDDGYAHVLELRKTRDISRTQALHEAKRRSILDRDYDPDADLNNLLDEMEGDDDNDDDTIGGDDTAPAV